MIDIILLEISLLFMFCYFLAKLRHGFHMLQLEYNMTKRYREWKKKNKKGLIKLRDCLLILATVLMLVNLRLGLVLLLIFSILLYLGRDYIIEKKEFVFTNRVKRQYVTAIFFFLITCVFINLFVIKTSGVWKEHFLTIRNILNLEMADVIYIAVSYAVGFLVNALIIFAMNFVSFVNIWNRPVEKSIADKFYKKAKNKLKDMPNLKIIGVTGSFGKTSSKYALNFILQQKYNVLITPGNYNTLSGVEKTINEKLKPTHEIFICEMGAKEVGDIKEICDLVEPDMGILTAIGPQHLDSFKSLENVRKTKMELVNSLPIEEYAFVNYEDENIRDTEISHKHQTYGFDKKCDVYGYDIKITNDGSEFSVHTPKMEIKNLKTKLLGKLNILNVVGAIAVAAHMGLSEQNIRTGVRFLKPVPHRLELKKMPNNSLIIDDAYNSNINGSKTAFETLKNFEDKTRILITPGLVEMGEEEEEFNKQFGKNAKGCADYYILVGKKQAQPIYDGLIEAKEDKKKVFIVSNINEAFAKANELATENRIMLLENDLPDNYL